MPNPDGTITVRVKASSQVVDMMPDAARALINGGLAEEVTGKGKRKESAMAEPQAEHAVAAAQAAPARKAVSRHR